MLPTEALIHAQHDLSRQRAYDHAQAVKVDEYLTVVLEALDCNRPHIAVEKIEVIRTMLLPSIGAPRD